MLTERINIRCTTFEKKALKETAERLEITLSDMLLGLGMSFIYLANQVDCTQDEDKIFSYLYQELGK